MNKLKIYCLDGDLTLPSTEKIDYLKQAGYTPCLFIDANICLLLATYYNTGKIDQELLMEMFTLIKYFQEGNAIFDPDYGVLELVKEKGSHTFQKDKFDEILDKVNYLFWYPVELHEIEFQKNLFPVEKYRGDYSSHNFFVSKMGSFFLLTYTTLLKIYSISKKRSPQKETFLANIREFLSWCESELNTSMLLEFALAIKIFGGDSDFKKMIAFDNTDSAENIFKILHATTWDLIHIKLILRELSDEKIFPIFITRDTNLYALLKIIVFELGFETYNDKPIFKAKINCKSFYSNYEHQEKVNQEVERFQKRMTDNFDPKADLQKIERLFPALKKLEDEIIDKTP